MKVKEMIQFLSYQLVSLKERWNSKLARFEAVEAIMLIMQTSEVEQDQRVFYRQFHSIHTSHILPCQQ